ncbi:MAG TPA: manganese efflux pump [Actinomycetota bacterium]|nr:manganese efflux pump [Actinomycetota bacterium]
MTTVAALVGVAVLDNLRVVVGLGTLDLTPRQRARIAAAFVLAETGAIVGGMGAARLLGPRLPELPEWVPSLVVVALGLALLVSARDAVGTAIEATAVLGTVAAALSWDNVVVGSTLGLMSVPLAPTVALVAAIVSVTIFTGVVAGGALARKLPRASALAGGLLVATAAAPWVARFA